MKPYSNCLAMIGLCFVLFTTGCASIMSGTSQSYTVRSVPEGAKATFTNHKGKAVAAQVTPCTVTLKRGDRYTVKIEKENYKTLEAPVMKTVNGWYLGNIIFGGLLGLAIIDPATGAMWSFVGGEMDTELAPLDSPKISAVIQGKGPVMKNPNTFPGSNPFNK